MGRTGVLAAATLLAMSASSPDFVESRTAGCDEHCVCDGVDLSHLGAGATFEVASVFSMSRGRG